MTQPTENDFSPSNTGSQVVPALVVFHTPPHATAIYQVCLSPGATAMSTTRPELIAGPMPRRASPLKVDDLNSVSTPEAPLARAAGAAVWARVWAARGVGAGVDLACGPAAAACARDAVVKNANRIARTDKRRVMVPVPSWGLEERASPPARGTGGDCRGDRRSLAGRAPMRNEGRARRGGITRRRCPSRIPVRDRDGGYSSSVSFRSASRRFPTLMRTK